MRWPWERPSLPLNEAGPRTDGREAFDLISKRLRECDDALRRNPNDPDALFTRGVFLARIGEYRRSLKCLERVTQIDSAYPGVWHLKSTLYRRVGELEKARACAEHFHAE